MKRILVIGDSWASAVVAGGGPDWVSLLGIPAALRQAVAGSTAAGWASNESGRLDLAAATQAEVVIISLAGNDAIRAMADGTVTIDEAVAMICSIQKVVSAVQKAETIVFLYADPFAGTRPETAFAVRILNLGIRIACPREVRFLETGSILKAEHFDGSDIHPNAAGHAEIAKAIRDLLEGTP